MSIPKIFLGLAAATLLVSGCAKREEPATKAVTSIEAAVVEVRPDAAKYAPEELKGVEEKLAALKADLAKEHYKQVLGGAGELVVAVNTLNDTVVAKKTQIQAATNEWTDLSKEVPPMVQAIQSRVDNLAGSRLPENVKKEAFDAAKSGLATMKSTWAEATAAFNAGNATEAADKGRLVKAKAEELQQQLAMSVV